MAKKAESFKLNEKKKVIIIYTNVEQSEVEKSLIEFYLKNGYSPMFEEKKSTKSVEDMRQELSADEAALKEFNRLYATKGGKEPGFFLACKYYTNWKKNNKK